MKLAGSDDFFNKLKISQVKPHTQQGVKKHTTGMQKTTNRTKICEQILYLLNYICSTKQTAAALSPVLEVPFSFGDCGAQDRADIVLCLSTKQI